MNDQLRVRIEAINRCHQHILDDPTKFATGKPKFHADRIAANQPTIQAASTGQATAEGGLLSASAQKQLDREVLRDQRSMLAKIARELEFDNPGITPKLQFDKNISDQELIATSRAAWTNSAAYEADLIDATMPATFRADLKTATDNFEASVGAKDSQLGDRVENTADLGTAVQDSMRSKRALDTMAPNIYADDPGKLAAWHTASHVEKVPVQKPRKPPA